MGIITGDVGDDAIERCETCELLACAYAAGVEQLLQASLSVDRSLRFSDAPTVAQAIAKVETLRPLAEQAWTNLLIHRAEH